VRLVRQCAASASGKTGTRSILTFPICARRRLPLIEKLDLIVEDLQRLRLEISGEAWLQAKIVAHKVFDDLYHLLGEIDKKWAPVKVNETYLDDLRKLDLPKRERVKKQEKEEVAKEEAA
jgi:hypothetical protein